jgi:hypothetical protein
MEWALVQQRHYQFLGSLRTGKRWLIALLTKLWDIAWDLGAHQNGILHHKENALLSGEQLQLDRDISKAYLELVQLAARRCKFLLSLSIRRLLEKDDKYKVTWLKQAVAAPRFHRRGFGRSLLFMKKIMGAWFRSSSMYGKPRPE